jgi:hypothetical protein
MAPFVERAAILPRDRPARALPGPCCVRLPGPRPQDSGPPLRARHRGPLQEGSAKSSAAPSRTVSQIEPVQVPEQDRRRGRRPQNHGKTRETLPPPWPRARFVTPKRTPPRRPAAEQAPHRSPPRNAPRTARIAHRAIVTSPEERDDPPRRSRTAPLPRPFEGPGTHARPCCTPATPESRVKLPAPPKKSPLGDYQWSERSVRELTRIHSDQLDPATYRDMWTN